MLFTGNKTDFLVGAGYYEILYDNITNSIWVGREYNSLGTVERLDVFCNNIN